MDWESPNSDVSDVGPAMSVGPTSLKKGQFRVNKCILGLTWSCPRELADNPISDVNRVLEFLETLGDLDKYCVAEELHESGKRHYHAYAAFKKPVDIRCPYAFNIAGVSADCVPGKVTKRFAMYCTKKGKFISNMRLPKPLYCPTMTGWQLEALKLIQEEPNKRCIYWIWEPSGKRGKSELVRYLCIKHYGLLVSGKASDMKHCIVQSCEKDDVPPELILIDMPRSSLNDDGKYYISYQGLEEIKNGLFCSPKYESKMFIMNPPHLLVFANERPDVSKMSGDRWKVGEIVGQHIQWEDSNIDKNFFL